METTGPLHPRFVHRVGDQERSAVCDELSAQYAVGRLAADELDARLTAVLRARTRGELAVPLTDLPPLPVSASSSGSPPVAVAPRVGTASAFPDTVAGLALLAAVGLALILLFGTGLSSTTSTTRLLALAGGTVAAAGGAAATHLLHRLLHRCETRP